MDGVDVQECEGCPLHRVARGSPHVDDGHVPRAAPQPRLRRRVAEQSAHPPRRGLVCEVSVDVVRGGVPGGLRPLRPQVVVEEDDLLHAVETGGEEVPQLGLVPGYLLQYLL